MQNQAKGITLIALVITIIVLLILAGVTIATLTGDNGIIGKAGEAKFKTKLSAVAEEYELYLTERFSEDRSFEEGALYAGKNALIYNSIQEEGNIYTVLKNSDKKYVDNFEVIKGELFYFAQNEQEKKWAQEIGIKVSPYIIIDGELMSTDKNLDIMDEVTGSIIIPQNVTKIGEGAFSNLDGLRTIVIPGTVKEIGTNAFRNNKTLEKVIIQDGVETIGDNAFRSCSNLKSVSMTDSVNNLKPFAFAECTNLQEINLSNGITKLSDSVFDLCPGLKEIILPEKLERIESASLACGNLTYLKIPETVTYIDPRFCFGRNNISEIDTTNNKNYIFKEGFLTTKSGDTICYISPQKLKEGNTFNIPEGVKNYVYSISNYTNIKKIILPSTLEILGENTWSCIPSSIEQVEVADGNKTFIVDNENKILYTKANKLILCYSKAENIKIKEGIVSVQDEALAPATRAKEIIFPDSLETLGYRALSRMATGVNIVLGKGLNSVGGNVIDHNDIYKIGEVTISEENQRYAIRDNILYSKDFKTLEKVLYGITGEFTVASNVEKMSNRAFLGENRMTDIILPPNLKVIGDTCFHRCSLLKKIEIPNTVEAIGSECFADCTNLAEIKINKKENSITGAPWGCPYGLRAIKWQ